MSRRGRQAVLLAAALVGLAACSSSEADAPELGTGGGPVVLAPLTSLLPGTVVPVRITSSLGERSVGGTCTLLEQWDDGAWEVRWNLRDAPEAPTPIVDGIVTCNAMGVSFPTEVALTLPADLEEGTWRLAYSWVVTADEAAGIPAESELATYTFEVGS